MNPCKRCGYPDAEYYCTECGYWQSHNEFDVDIEDQTIYNAFKLIKKLADKISSLEDKIGYMENNKK